VDLGRKKKQSHLKILSLVYVVSFLSSSFKRNYQSQKFIIVIDSN